MIQGKILFGSNDQFGCMENGKITMAKSAYHQRYNRTREKIQSNKAWKTQGSGAQFMGMGGHPGQAGQFDQERTIARINGLALMKGLDQVIYTISVNEMSGIFIKDFTCADAPEGHVVHDSSVDFLSIDYDQGQDKLVAAIKVSANHTHIGTVNLGSGHYTLVTEGECIDENPTWSKTRSRMVYYDTCGVGVDSRGALQRSTKSICSLDLATGDLQELVSDPNQVFDFVKPKEDSAGNLYYIKRPMKTLPKRQTSLLDVLLIPGKLISAIFGWLDFFTMRYSGQSLKNKAGGTDNPAKLQQKTPEQIFIEGNLINVQEAMAQHQAAGEAHPGSVPPSWELIKRDRNGKTSVVCKGVLDYAICDGGPDGPISPNGPIGPIVYSNGKHIMALPLEGGSAKLLGSVEVATSLSFCI